MKENNNKITIENIKVLIKSKGVCHYTFCNDCFRTTNREYGNCTPEDTYKDAKEYIFKAMLNTYG